VQTATRDPETLRTLVNSLSTLHLLLALNFFFVVPFLGWLNYGRASWATAWIPDIVMLFILPAAYFVYWHFWFVVAVPAIFSSLYLHHRTGDGHARRLAIANSATVGLFWIVRLVFASMGIHPDIV
jgi:fatty acid desaturase